MSCVNDPYIKTRRKTLGICLISTKSTFESPRMEDSYQKHEHCHYYIFLLSALLIMTGIECHCPCMVNKHFHALLPPGHIELQLVQQMVGSLEHIDSKIRRTIYSFTCSRRQEHKYTTRETKGRKSHNIVERLIVGIKGSCCHVGYQHPSIRPDFSGGGIGDTQLHSPCQVVILGDPDSSSSWFGFVDAVFFPENMAIPNDVYVTWPEVNPTNLGKLV